MNRMTANKYKGLVASTAILLFLVFSLSARNAQAASVELESDYSKISVGDTVVADVIMDTEGETINVVDGSISIPNGLKLVEIKELSVASSALSQWARTPSWSQKDGTISFVGGFPGGINKKFVPLFRIFFTAKSAGQVTFMPAEVKAYVNDGLATQAGVHVTPLTVTINPEDNLPVKDELKSIITHDFKAPANINIELGQDSSLFNGQRFITLAAVDSESGIDYFEVKEGNREPVKATNYYVLQDQDQLEPLIVFAFDKAGNISKKVYAPQTNTSVNYYLIAILSAIFLGTLALLFVLYRQYKKRKKVIK